MADEGSKLTLRRLEAPIHKFIKVALPTDLERLQKHHNNILKVRSQPPSSHLHAVLPLQTRMSVNRSLVFAVQAQSTMGPPSSRADQRQQDSSGRSLQTHHAPMLLCRGEKKIFIRSHERRISMVALFSFLIMWQKAGTLAQRGAGSTSLILEACFPNVACFGDDYFVSGCSSKQKAEESRRIVPFGPAAQFSLPASGEGGGLLSQTASCDDAQMCDGRKASQSFPTILCK